MGGGVSDRFQPEKNVAEMLEFEYWLGYKDGRSEGACRDLGTRERKGGGRMDARIVSWEEWRIAAKAVGFAVQPMA